MASPVDQPARFSGSSRLVTTRYHRPTLGQTSLDLSSLDARRPLSTRPSRIGYCSTRWHGMAIECEDVLGVGFGRRVWPDNHHRPGRGLPPFHFNAERPIPTESPVSRPFQPKSLPTRKTLERSSHDESPKNLGMKLLAAWLIAFGLLSLSFLQISFAHSADLLAVLGIAAGVLLLLDR